MTNDRKKCVRGVFNPRYVIFISSLPQYGSVSFDDVKIYRGKPTFKSTYWTFQHRKQLVEVLKPLPVLAL